MYLYNRKEFRLTSTPPRRTCPYCGSRQTTRITECNDPVGAGNKIPIWQRRPLANYHCKACDDYF